MATIKSLGRKAWRKYATDGVAATGFNRPDTIDIFPFVDAVDAAVEDLQGQIDDIALEADSVSTASWTALALITGSRPGQGGYVGSGDSGTHTDPVVGGTVDNAGKYAWSASPAGWHRIDDLPPTADDLDAILASFIAAQDSLLSFQRIGRQADPVAGTSVSHTNFVMADAIENDGHLAAIAVVKGISGGGTVHMKHGTLSGSTFHHTRSDFDITVSSGSGVQLFTADDFGEILATAGWHPGFNGGGTTGVNQHVGATAATPADGAGWYSGGTGNVTSDITLGSVQSGSRLEIYWLYGYQSVTAENVETIKGQAEAASASNEALARAVIAANGVADAVEYLGAFAPVASGLRASAGTYVLVDVYEGAGDRTVDSVLKGFTVATDGSGGGAFGIWSRSGITCTAVRTIDLTWDDADVFDFEEGVTEGWTVGLFDDIAPGHFIGLYNDGTVCYLSGTPNPGYYFGSGNVNQFDRSTPNSTTIQIQVKGIVGYRAINLAGTTTLADPTVFDAFGVLGQSNHLGTAVDYGETPRAGIALMWQKSTGTLVPLADPTGNLGTPKGSMWPAFAAEYFARTGRGVAIMNMAKGGSGLVTGTGGAFGNWSPDGTLLADFLAEWALFTAALDAGGYAWQPAGVLGVSMETDAIAIDASSITASAYLSALGALRTSLETGTGMGSRMPWIIQELGTLTAGNTAGAQAIRAKQREFVRSSPNTFLGWTGAKNLAGRSLMEADNLHWKQAGQTECGKNDAGLAAAVSVGLA